MHPETSLPEVAHFLGAEAASTLFEQPFLIQSICLVQVRDYLFRLESAGVTLDPILMEEHLHSIVMTMLEGMSDG